MEEEILYPAAILLGERATHTDQATSTTRAPGASSIEISPPVVGCPAIPTVNPVRLIMKC